MTKYFFLFSMLIGLFFTVGDIPAGGSGETQQAGDPSSARRVLIATENTQFKNSLVKKIVELLDDGKTYIKIVDHSKKGLEGEDPAAYSAVFITNSGASARVRPAVMNWLDSIGGKDKNVILHTTQITVWDPPVKVDSITSASSMTDLEPIAKKLTEKIRRLL